MLKNMLLIALMSIVSLSFVSAQQGNKQNKRNQYGKILYTKDSFKDTVSDINYTVSERGHRNLFLHKKHIITIEFDFANFISTNKNLDNGAYQEDKFIMACRKLNADVTRIYSIVYDYMVNTYYEDEEIREVYYIRPIKERIKKRWLSDEMWMRARITHSPLLDECPGVKPHITELENGAYGFDCNEMLIYGNMDAILIKLLKLHRLAYTAYPQEIIYVDLEKKVACKQ